MNYDVMKAAFEDELEKIAGSMTKAIRGGKRPYRMENFLKKHAGVLKAVGESAIKHKKELALLGGGAAVYEGARTVNEDRRLGRQIRLQNQGQGF